MAWRIWKAQAVGKPKKKPATKLRKLLEELHEHEKYWRNMRIDIDRFNSDGEYRIETWRETRGLGLGSSIPWRRSAPKQPYFRPCLQDDFQRFKRDFISEWDGDKVQPTGMTHKEFHDYFTTGRREGVAPGDYDFIFA